MEICTTTLGEVALWSETEGIDVAQAKLYKITVSEKGVEVGALECLVNFHSKRIELNTIVIHSHHNRYQSYGRVLMSVMLEIAEDYYIADVIVNAIDDAVPFYQKFNFEPICHLTEGIVLMRLALVAGE